MQNSFKRASTSKRKFQKFQHDSITHRKNCYLNLKNRLFNFISSIRSKSTFRTDINLSDFNKLRF